jgi:hypothetical protein
MSAAVGTPDQEPTRRLDLLILQLGTPSEMYRSLMALKAVKQLYPHLCIRILTRPETLEPLSRVEWIEETLLIPAGLNRENALPRVAQWLGGVIDRRFDILVNWTAPGSYSRMGALVTTLIPAIVKLGDHVRDDLSIGSHDAWSMYRHAWMAGGVEQDIHETDVITTQLLTALQIHAGEPSPDAGTHQVTSRYFFRQPTVEPAAFWTARPKGLKWIAISSERAPARLSEWMERVLRRNPDYGMVIVGSEAITDLPESPRIIRMEEGLDWDSRLMVLSQCSWLISGPGPIVDLASLVNLRVFYIPEQTEVEFGLKWAETGPYGNGHVACVTRKSWDPDSAYAAWSYYQSEWFHKNSITIEGHFEHLGLSRMLPEIQIYKSRIRPANEGGGVCYEQTAGAKREFESWMVRVRGQMARAWFCGWLPSLDQEASRLQLSPALIQKIRGVQDSIRVITQIVSGARGTALELSDLSTRNRVGHLMSVEDREAIETCGRKLLEMEALISRVTRVEPELHCLLQWYRQRVHNLESPTLQGMARETVQALDLVMEGLDLIEAWTGKTLELARPRAVGTRAEIRDQGLDN